MWQETVLFEHKRTRKVLSLNKTKSSEVQEIVWGKSMKIRTQLLITWCPLVVFLSHWYTSNYFYSFPLFFVIYWLCVFGSSTVLSFVTELWEVSLPAFTNEEGVFVGISGCKGTDMFVFKCVIFRASPTMCLEHSLAWAPERQGFTSKCFFLTFLFLLFLRGTVRGLLILVFGLIPNVT